MTDFEDANDNEGSLLVIRLATLCLEAGWYSWLRAAAISVIMLSHCNFKRNHTLFRRGFHEAAAKANLSCRISCYRPDGTVLFGMADTAVPSLWSSALAHNVPTMCAMVNIGSKYPCREDQLND